MIPLFGADPPHGSNHLSLQPARPDWEKASPERPYFRRVNGQTAAWPVHRSEVKPGRCQEIQAGIRKDIQVAASSTRRTVRTASSRLLRGYSSPNFPRKFPNHWEAFLWFLGSQFC